MLLNKMIIKKIKRTRRSCRYKQKQKRIVFRAPRHSAYVGALWEKKFENRTKKRESVEYFVRILNGLQANNIPKPGNGLVYMKFGRRSFHLGFSKMATIKNKSKFAKKTAKKKGFSLQLKKTIGQLQMFKGRARSSAVARKTLAGLFVKDLIKRHVHIVDLCLKSEMGKHYFAVNSALARKNLVIRTVTRLVSRPHGYMRKKKQRRT